MRKLLLGLFFGLLTQAALAQAPSSLPGCQYLATPPTLSDKQTSVWQCDINGKLITSGGGNVVGPASSTDNALARWDGTTGQLLQDSTVIVGDAATGTIRFGAALDAAAPVAQTLSVQSVIAGTANTAGAAFTIAGSKSTGSAAGGSIIFQTAAAGGAGSSQNALATALTIDSTKLATFAAGVTALGTFIAPDTNGYTFLSGGANYRLAWSSGIGVTFYEGAAATTSFSGGISFGAGQRLGWSSTAAPGNAPDTNLYRDAANTLALRNSTTAQKFRVYDTWTDASNGRWVGYEQNGMALRGNGTGVTTDSLYINNTLNAGVLFYTNATYRWQMDQNGHLIAGTDNTYDIGASGATRPRNVYVAGNIVANSQGNFGSYVTVGDATGVGSTSRGIIQFPADGVFKLQDNAGTSFGRLQFGGTTSSFPAIARNGIKLEAKLADDSTYASFAARGLIVAGAVPTLALAGGTCAGTVIAGGSTAGTVTLTGVCVATNTMALTVMPTAPTGYACDAIDRTLGSSLLTETATTATSVTFTFGGTTGATDVLAYKCLAY